MENFQFHNPTKVIFGRDTIGLIGEEIRGAGLGRVLLIAGGGSIRSNGVYDQVVESLEANGLEWVESWGVKANPDLVRAREILAEGKGFGADVILAVGGGSVIDTAKGVAGGFYVDDIWDLFEAGDEVVRGLPLFTVLTLSATGSELNPFAVLSNEVERKKWSVWGRGLSPIASVIDPVAQFSLPWHQTANGAIDAISHVMEQYFSGERSETTMAIAESLIRSVVEATDVLQENPEDYDARASLAWAASLALNGLMRTGTGSGDWATHMIEHGLSAVRSDIAHGAGLGVVFPAWIRYVGADGVEAFDRWAWNVWGADSLEEGVLMFQEKIRQWGNPTRLDELGINGDNIDDVVACVMQKPLGQVRVLDEADVRAILELATR